jgi:hypothetical protein
MIDLKLMVKLALIVALFGLAATLGGCASDIQRTEMAQATNGAPST